MCNAWNHPPGCTCGWGGEGHLGGGGSSSFYSLKSIHHRIDKFETYVNPNAKCPVCKIPVYFYQSPDGGRVFFDELGPPWPKHPCTDLSNREIFFQPQKPTKPNWLSDRWLPATVIKETRSPTNFISLRLMENNRHFLVEAFTSFKQNTYLKEKCLLIFVREKLSDIEVEVIGKNLTSFRWRLKRKKVKK